MFSRKASGITKYVKKSTNQICLLLKIPHDAATYELQHEVSAWLHSLVKRYNGNGRDSKKVMRRAAAEVVKEYPLGEGWRWSKTTVSRNPARFRLIAAMPLPVPVHASSTFVSELA